MIASSSIVKEVLMFRPELLISKSHELPRDYDWEKWVLELKDLPKGTMVCETEMLNQLIRRVRGLVLTCLAGRF